MLAPKGVDPEDALAAGLLQNIGLNVISVCAPDLFQLTLDVTAAGHQLRDFEEVVFGFTHAELGGRVAGRWSYPLSLSTAILEHDVGDPTTPLAAVVHVADRLVRQAGIGVEAATDPLPAALALSRIGDLAQARARLQLLLDAQERFDLHVDAEALDQVG
jgi:HD-like signal output (HDOD) protein